jgi:hypothetical protein
MSFQKKYLKYKNKYFALKNQFGNGKYSNISFEELLKLQLTPLCENEALKRYLYKSNKCPDYIFESTVPLTSVPSIISIKCWKSTNVLPDINCEINDSENKSSQATIFNKAPSYYTPDDIRRNDEHKELIEKLQLDSKKRKKELEEKRIRYAERKAKLDKEAKEWELYVEEQDARRKVIFMEEEKKKNKMKN